MLQSSSDHLEQESKVLQENDKRATRKTREQQRRMESCGSEGRMQGMRTTGGSQLGSRSFCRNVEMNHPGGRSPRWEHFLLEKGIYLLPLRMSAIFLFKNPKQYLELPLFASHLPVFMLCMYYYFLKGHFHYNRKKRAVWAQISMLFFLNFCVLSLKVLLTA